jgi:hypothetical protein
MSEQTYMKLQDKVNRPKFSRENINRENKHFKRVVDQYQKWCTSDGGYEETRETYENDIIECLERYDLDGFALAQYLSEYKYIEPDSELVHILEDVTFVKSSLETEMLSQWVKENFLTIPDDVVGKNVNVKQGIRKYENHYITGIKTETYQVTVSDKIDKNGGYIVGFENVTFL